jgi:hypothetical protein
VFGYVARIAGIKNEESTRFTMKHDGKRNIYGIQRYFGKECLNVS